MKAEKVILSFIGVCIGLLVAGAAFYFYQSTRTIAPKNIKSISVISPTQTPPSSNHYLVIETPKNEQVVDQKTITITGKTPSDATVIILTDASEEIVTPAQNGSFNTTITIGDGENVIMITSILPTGEEISETRTVTYSTESF